MERGNDLNLRNPWLIAAWPGMGQVASIAARYLVESTGAEAVGAIPERRFFTRDHVEVKDGIARSGRLPRNLFFVRRDPERRRDLLIFVGEAQPPARGDELCRRIIDVASSQNVERVVTFAAMSTRITPTDDPRVFGAVTRPELLDDLDRWGVERVVGGRIRGLNGSLLATAADHDLPAMCLLGEFPFFAAGVPNPKAALAVLDALSCIADLPLDLDTLADGAEKMEPNLLQLMSQIGDQQEEMEGDEDLADEFDLTLEEDDDEPEPEIGVMARARIEELFDAARTDRAIAQNLKEELDRLGVFPEYEDRFLDLFK